nr:phosphoprotein [Perhabdovirus perca]
MLSAKGLKNWSLAKEGIDELARGIQSAGQSEENSLDMQPEVGEFKSKTASVLKQWEEYEKTLGSFTDDEPVLPSDSGFQESAESIDPSLESWVSPDPEEEMEVEGDWTVHRGELAGKYSDREQNMIYREMNIMLGFVGGYLTLPKDGEGYILTLPTPDKLERMREAALRHFQLHTGSKEDPSKGIKVKPQAVKKAETRKPDPVKPAPKTTAPKPDEASTAEPEMPKETPPVSPPAAPADPNDGFDIVENIWDYGIIGFDSARRQAKFHPLKMGWDIGSWRAAAREIDPCAPPNQFFELMIKKSQKRNIFRRKYLNLNFSF